MDVLRYFLPLSGARSTTWLSVAATAALVACAPPPPPPAPPPPPPYDAALHARVLAASDVRRGDVLLLDSAITAPHPAVRAAAALAIGQIGVRALVPQLIAATRDADTLVARNATFAIGLVRDSSQGITLRSLADSAPVSVGVQALWALGELGEPVRPALVDLLADTSVRESRWRRELLLAAAKLRPVPVPQILPHLASSDTDLVWAGAYALARQRVPAGARALLSLAASPSSAVRAQVARGVARPAVGDSLASEARTALTTLARDREAHVRINAVRSLATFGASDMIAKLAEDLDPNVRIAAAQSAVAPAGGPMPRIYFERLYTADTAWMYRRSVMESAFRAGIRLAGAGEWLQSRDWRFRAAVAGAMGAARTPDALDALDQLTRDADGRVRAAALGALAASADSGDAAPRVRTMLLVALRDPDLFARAAALNALAGVPRPDEAQFVLQSYRTAEADKENDARLAAIRYLSAAWKRDTALVGRGVRDALRSLPAPRDARERAAANGSPLFAHWGRPTVEPRPAAWYDEVALRFAVADSAPVVDIVTERGTVVVQLLAREAPLTVQNFVTLARRGFYDGLRFHRVVPNFVVQDGDPRGDGNGGPGYAIRDELNPVRYERGVVGMALSGPDTGGSQYFITHSSQPHLDGHYTAFGRVVSGLDVLDALVQGDQIRRVHVR